MALPKAVQAQVEEADRLVADINGDKTEGDPTETDPRVQPQEPAETVADPQPSAVSTESVQNLVPEEKWESKYHTLKGMYDAEVPRLHSQNRELTQQVQQLIADMAELKAKQTTNHISTESLITEQDKEAFGPDLIDLIERATESKVAVFRQREEQLMEEIKELKGQMGSVAERQVMSDKDRFLMGLGQQVPDWEALNVNQGFLAWLNEVDPVYGVPRQVALNNAYENLDVPRVATIFNAYKALITPATPQKKPSQELQRQVAPTRSKANAPDPADLQNQRIWTDSMIQQFYDEARRGHYSPEDVVRTENEISAAIAEGRYRP